MSTKEKQPRSKSSPVTGPIPYLISTSAKEHIEWLKKVFHAKVTGLHWTDAKGSPMLVPTEEAKPEEGWQVMHASLEINGGALYLSDHIQSSGYPEHFVTPADVRENKGRGIMMHLECGDEVDAVWKRAMAEKAASRMELAQQFWGARYGVFVDPYGVEWAVSRSDPDGNASKKAKVEEGEVEVEKEEEDKAHATNGSQ